MNKLVSVIMSVYNETQLQLKESIESILKQTYKYFEFIIILDNPENKKLLNILNAYASKDKRIRLYINNKNEGLVYSLNKALSLSQGEFIARMDADDISLKCRIEQQYHYLINNNFDLIGANIYNINEKGEKLFPVYFASDKYIKMMLCAAVMNVCHPTFFAKKDLYIALQGYRNIKYAEDVDFIVRAMCQDYKIGNINKILLYYRTRRNSVTSLHSLLANKTGKKIAKAYWKCCLRGRYILNEDNLIVKNDDKKNYFYSQRFHLIAIRYKGKKNYFLYLKYMFLTLKYPSYFIDYLRLRIMGVLLAILQKDNNKGKSLC